MEEEEAEEEQSRKRQAESEKEVSGCVSCIPTYKSERYTRTQLFTATCGVNSNIANLRNICPKNIIPNGMYVPMHIPERKEGGGGGGLCC